MHSKEETYLRSAFLYHASYIKDDKSFCENNNLAFSLPTGGENSRENPALAKVYWLFGAIVLG